MHERFSCVAMQRTDRRSRSIGDNRPTVAGCNDAMSEHMGAVLPFLATACDDQMPLVRSVGCWALSQWAKWVSHGQLQSLWIIPTAVVS